LSSLYSMDGSLGIGLTAAGELELAGAGRDVSATLGEGVKRAPSSAKATERKWMDAGMRAEARPILPLCQRSRPLLGSEIDARLSDAERDAPAHELSDSRQAATTAATCTRQLSNLFE